MRKLSLLIGLLLLTVIGPVAARAEHRVALLIGNSKYKLIGNSKYKNQELNASATDLKGLAGQLEKYGVRSTILENLTGEQLTRALDSFTDSTPTRGVGLVYFSGQVLPGNRKGKDANFLVGVDAEGADERSVGNAGYSVDELLANMYASGGSSQNILLLDAANPPPQQQNALPNDCLLAYLQGTKISGGDDLLASIRQAASWSESTIPTDSKVTGNGSSVVSSPDIFQQGKRAGDEWVNGRGMVFCWCPPGMYTAGSPEDEAGRYEDEQQHEVQIEQGFWISKYEMTMRENPRDRDRRKYVDRKNEPLTMVNHDDARRMTTYTLTSQEQDIGRLPRDWQYSLPTEDQWEYAARAGTTSRYYFGDDVNQLPRHGNFGDKSYYDTRDVYSVAADRVLDDAAPMYAVVGSYAANPWGLHDICGNVAEWGIDYSIRGGSWLSNPANCRSAYRDHFSSRNQQPFIGYRLIIQKTPADFKVKK